MSPSVGVLKKPIVLLAEDSPAEQRLAQRALAHSPLHCDLRLVSDGKEAMDYLLHRPPYEQAELAPRPHLLLLDLNMPKLDGRQVLREIKSNPELATIPVVVLTTSKQEQDILQSYHLGCNSFINKPVDVHEFFDMMRKLSRYWLDLVLLPPDKG
jgi:CheY-like chemotaxis protein